MQSAVRPIHLICENQHFINELENLLVSKNASKQTRKRQRRKIYRLVEHMDQALDQCVKSQNAERFKHFLQNLKTSFTQEKLYLLLQECQRYLNSSEVTFAQKFTTKWRLGGVSWVGEGKLLAALNEQLKHAIQENNTRQTYSARELYDGFNQWLSSINFGHAAFGLVLLNSIVAVGSSSTKSCIADESPLAYSWRRQCHSEVPLSLQMSSEQASLVNQNFLVYSNYPLEYVQVFGFGLTHSLDQYENENDQRIAKTISAIARPFERVFREGFSHDNIYGCNSSLFVTKEGQKIFSDDPWLICQGWEIKKAFSKATKHVKKINDTNSKLLVKTKELQEEIQFLSKEFKNKIDALSGKSKKCVMELEQITVEKAKVFFMRATSWDELVKQENKLLKELSELKEELNKLKNEHAERSAALDRRIEERPKIRLRDENKVIAARNKGIIQLTQSSFAKTPEARLFITSGAAHFFSNRSDGMTTYQPQDKIAELRRYFETLDEQGKPVALLVNVDDEFSNRFKK